MTLKQITFLKTCYRLPGLDPDFLYKDAQQSDTFIFFLLNQVVLLNLPGIKLITKSYLAIGDNGYAAELFVNGTEYQLVIIFEKDESIVDIIKKLLTSINELIREERQKQPEETPGFKNNFLEFLGLKKGVLNYHLIRKDMHLYIGCLPEKISLYTEFDSLNSKHLPQLKPFPLAAFSYQDITETPVSLLAHEYGDADAALLSELTGHIITNNKGWHVVIRKNQKDADLECGNSYHSVVKKLNELTRSSGMRLHITSFPWRKELIFLVGREQEKTYKKVLSPEDHGGSFEETQDQRKLELIEAYLAKNGDDISAIATLSTCYGNTGRHQKTLDIIDTYLPLAPDHFTLLNNRLIAYTKLKKYREGIEAGEKVLQTCHQRYNTHYFMSVCYIGLEKFDEALFHSRQSIIDSPNRPYNIFQLAYTYYRMNDLDKAIENYHLTINAASAHNLTKDPIPSVFYNLACLYSVQNKIAESAEAFRKAVELNPKYKNDLYEDDEFENLRNAMSEEELFGEE